MNTKKLSTVQKLRIVVPTVAIMAASGTLPAMAEVDPNITAATADADAIFTSLNGSVGDLKTLMGAMIGIVLVVTAVVAGHRLWKRLQAQAG